MKLNMERGLIRVCLVFSCFGLVLAFIGLGGQDFKPVEIWTLLLFFLIFLWGGLMGGYYLIKWVVKGFKD